MVSVSGPIGLLLSEGTIVHQKIGTTRYLGDRTGGSGVARVHDTPAGPRPTHDLIRTDGTAVYFDRLAPMQTAEEGSFRNAQRARPLHIETA